MSAFTPPSPLVQKIRYCFEARLIDLEANRHAHEIMRDYLAGDANWRSMLLAAIAQVAAADNDSQVGLSEMLDRGRFRFFKRFNALPEGLAFLLKLREDMLERVREDALLESLQADLGSLFSAWFDVGFLELRPLTWDSPASLLEKLMRYEAVHAISSWTDLRNRLDADRRCFAFFHPRMPDEPLIFVEVALEREMSENVQMILDESAPLTPVGDARWAIFYSISNTQVGLRGVSFGNFLLKRVIDAVKQSSPKVERFATLSPLPGFARWLKQCDATKVASMLGPRRLRRSAQLGAMPETLDGASLAGWLVAPDEEGPVQEVRREVALVFAAHYLGGQPGIIGADPVARFHLGNGAQIERINWRADQSTKGMQQSLGLMVNYRYRLDRLDANLAALAAGEVPMARSIGRLLS